MTPSTGYLISLVRTERTGYGSDFDASTMTTSSSSGKQAVNKVMASIRQSKRDKKGNKSERSRSIDMKFNEKSNKTICYVTNTDFKRPMDEWHDIDEETKSTIRGYDAEDRADRGPKSPSILIRKAKLKVKNPWVVQDWIRTLREHLKPRTPSQSEIRELGLNLASTPPRYFGIEEWKGNFECLYALSTEHIAWSASQQLFGAVWAGYIPKHVFDIVEERREITRKGLRYISRMPVRLEGFAPIEVFGEEETSLKSRVARCCKIVRGQCKDYPTVEEWKTTFLRAFEREEDLDEEVIQDLSCLAIRLAATDPEEAFLDLFTEGGMLPSDHITIAWAAAYELLGAAWTKPSLLRIESGDTGSSVDEGSCDTIEPEYSQIPENSMEQVQLHTKPGSQREGPSSVNEMKHTEVEVSSARGKAASVEQVQSHAKPGSQSEQGPSSTNEKHLEVESSASASGKAALNGVSENKLAKEMLSADTGLNLFVPEDDLESVTGMEIEKVGTNEDDPENMTGIHAEKKGTRDQDKVEATSQATREGVETSSPPKKKKRVQIHATQSPGKEDSGKVKTFAIPSRKEKEDNPLSPPRKEKSRGSTISKNPYARKQEFFLSKPKPDRQRKSRVNISNALHGRKHVTFVKIKLPGVWTKSFVEADNEIQDKFATLLEMIFLIDEKAMLLPWNPNSKVKAISAKSARVNIDNRGTALLYCDNLFITMNRPSWVRLRIAHDCDAKEWDDIDHKTEFKNRDMFIGVDRIQAQKTACAGWLLGSHQSTDPRALEECLKNLPQLKGMQIEVRWQGIKLKNKSKIPTEQLIKACHVHTDFTTIARVKMALNRIYGSSNRDKQYPLGKVMRFVPQVSDTRFPVSPKALVNASRCVSRQKVFLSKMVSINCYVIAHSIIGLQTTKKQNHIEGSMYENQSP